MNVLEYFRAAFPVHVIKDASNVDALKSMPLDSNCGEDCKAAIDRARKFLPSIAEAFGDEPNDHWRGHKIREELASGVVEVCRCFITG